MKTIKYLLKSLSIQRCQRGPDYWWSRQDLLLQGVIKQIREQLKKSKKVVLISHFPKTLIKLEQELKKAGIQFERSSGQRQNWKIQLQADQRIILLFDSESLPLKSKRLDIDDVQHDLFFIISERYPTPDRTRRLEYFAKSLHCNSTFSFHCALDDIFFKFWPEEELNRIKNSLEAIGWNDEEPLILDDSFDDTGTYLLRNLIDGIQKQIEKTACGDKSAESCEQWLDYNCKT